MQCFNIIDRTYFHVILYYINYDFLHYTRSRSYDNICLYIYIYLYYALKLIEMHLLVYEYVHRCIYLNVNIHLLMSTFPRLCILRKNYSSQEYNFTIYVNKLCN